MCLILLAYKRHPDYRLILAVNRDEFYDRPTAPAAFWPHAPEILAGRDLVGKGSWLGFTRGGRLAVLSNYRDPAERHRRGRSRGLLLSDFLRGKERPRVYLEQVARQRARYKSFNLIVGDPTELCYYSNRQNRLRSLAPGLYGLSNHLLDTPWPKVARGKEAMAALLAGGESPRCADLFALLADTTGAADALLPDTGVGLAWERILSSAFIVSPHYGTRSSTLLLIAHDDRVTFVERTFHPFGKWREVQHEFRVER